MKGRAYDLPRIRHLLKLGVFASLLALAGDMLLGWGTADPSAAGIPATLSRYLSVSDGRIAASALLGLVGIPIECLCWFAVYRLIEPFSERDAHAYRAGIIGCLAFGACGVHVPCCMAAYLMKRLWAGDAAAAPREMLRWLGFFLLPATVLFLVFFLLAAVVQYRAFRKGHTPLPRRCRMYTVLAGLAWAALMKLAGDHALTNALATGWISVGNLWMTAGLLIETGKLRE